MKFLMAAMAVLAVAAADPACAWGDFGHEVTALIAYRHLTHRSKIALDALLAGDPDTLTAPAERLMALKFQPVKESSDIKDSAGVIRERTGAEIRLPPCEHSLANHRLHHDRRRR